MLDATRRSPFYGPEHEAFRATIRRFVEREIEPHASAWDEAGEFPRELYARAADVGLLGLGFPEEYGGIPGDRFMKILATQEFARAASAGSRRVSSAIRSGRRRSCAAARPS
jgi:acyl-CoA dehydrogenase